MTGKKHTTAQRLGKLEKDYETFSKVLSLIYSRQEVILGDLKELNNPDDKELKKGV
tara:strand:- start:492 stop:659 length:168 start_codon:yes stop_codon:yes gene_type:complete